MVQNNEKLSLGQKWSALQPTKTFLFWSCLAFIVLTMIVGFAWGGWVTGGTARERAEERAEAAVVDRLAPICVAQFDQDAEKEKKLEELKKTSSWQRGDYVEKQGWAKMPGAEKSDNDVAEECAKRLVQAG